ncbi:MAG: hypothetical protein K2X81_14900 [Candidatus Obscuribacterales bacterium]|nr:hypothetical protein [Candidatus Obscuribacterales bacterium]
MSLTPKNRHNLQRVSTVLACLMSCSSAMAQQLPNFVNEGKGNPAFPDADHRFVVLNSGLAGIVSQRFQLPASTTTYSLAGMTIFPYYQASAPLKEFLNSNVPGTALPITQVQPVAAPLVQILPATDYIRMNIPIPTQRFTKSSSTQLAVRDRRLKDEVQWMVAHQGGQAFGIPGDQDGLVLVSPGTMFAACAQRTMAIRCGTMWVMTGAKPAAVLTKHGMVGVKPFTIAAIEQTWFNRVRAADLFGQPLEFQVAHNGTFNKVNVEKGKEFTVSESATASSGTSDFVDTEKPTQIASKVPSTIPDLSTVTKDLEPDSSSFVSELKGITPPFTNVRMTSNFQKMFSDFGVTPAMRREEIRKQILQKNNVATKQAVFKASLDARYFVPVYKPAGEKAPVPFPHTSQDLKTLWVQQGVARYLSDSDLAIGANGRMAMTTGEAVFCAEDPMTVNVNDCQVAMRGGAFVQVVSKKDSATKEDVIVVRNLRELNQNNVLVRIKGRSIALGVGCEVVIGKSMPAISNETKLDGVTRRNVKLTEIADGTVFLNRSEIELTSLMQFSPIMRQLFNSKDRNDQKLVAQIMKMTAVLNMVTAGHGAYQRMAGLPSAHKD